MIEAKRRKPQQARPDPGQPALACTPVLDCGLERCEIGNAGLGQMLRERGAAPVELGPRVGQHGAAAGRDVDPADAGDLDDQRLAGEQFFAAGQTASADGEPAFAARHIIDDDGRRCRLQPRLQRADAARGGCGGA